MLGCGSTIATAGAPRPNLRGAFVGPGAPCPTVRGAFVGPGPGPNLRYQTSDSDDGYRKLDRWLGTDAGTVTR